MSNSKVLFLSYELNKNAQRGIYQFSKVLVEAIQKNNYEISLFTQVYNSDTTEMLLDIYKCLDDPKKYFLKDHHVSKIFFSYFKYIFFGNRYNVIKNNSDFKSNFDYLGFFENFINQPTMYYSANVNLFFPKIFNEKKILIKNFSKSDIIFTSSPLAIKSDHHKVVQTVHDLIPLQDRNKFYKYFKKRLSSCSKADKILLVSEYSKNKFLEYFPQMHDRVQVVYQPLPADENSIYLSSLPEIQHQVLDKYNLKSGQYMYYVGAVEKRKNIHNLVQAYAQATHSDKSIPLVISGSIDEEYKKEFLLENYLVNQRDFSYSKFNILKTDFVSDVEKLCLIRNSRAFLFPSLNEGFGIPIIEAQTLGVPVLTSNNSSLPEVTEGSALMLQNPLDVEEMAECIKRLWADDALCKNFSSKGLINIKRFSKNNFKKGIGDFLADI